MTTSADGDSHDRLGEALTRLDPRSRRLVELWLSGLGPREIAAQMRIRDEVVSALGETAFHRLRRLLARRPWRDQPLDGDAADGRAEGGPGPAMTRSRSSSACRDEPAD